jgi:hypothetical protein
MTSIARPFPMSQFCMLLNRCPLLNDVHIDHFKLDMDTLNLLIGHLPNLASFSAVGHDALGAITPQLEKIICSFIDGHRYLQKLHLGVSKIELDGYNLISEESFAADIDAAGSFDTESDSLRLLQVANSAVYARYASYLRSRFWWLKDVVFKGPLK